MIYRRKGITFGVKTIGGVEGIRIAREAVWREKATVGILRAAGVQGSDVRRELFIDPVRFIRIKGGAVFLFYTQIAQDTVQARFKTALFETGPGASEMTTIERDDLPATGGGLYKLAHIAADTGNA